MQHAYIRVHCHLNLLLSIKVQPGLDRKVHVVKQRLLNVCSVEIGIQEEGLYFELVDFGLNRGIILARGRLRVTWLNYQLRLDESVFELGTCDEGLEQVLGADVRIHVSSLVCAFF